MVNMDIEMKFNPSSLTILCEISTDFTVGAEINTQKNISVKSRCYTCNSNKYCNILKADFFLSIKLISIIFSKNVNDNFEIV